MKQIQQIIMIMLLITFSGCGSSKQKGNTSPNTLVSFVSDVTGRQKSVDAKLRDEILKAYQFNNDNLYGQVMFRNHVVSASSDRDIIEYTLQPGSAIFDNQIQRISKVRQFAHDIEAAFKKLEQPEAEKEFSLVYQTIIAEIEVLKAMPGDKDTKRLLIISSDCLQNDGNGFSFYDPATFSEAQRNPDKVIERLLKQYNFPDATGITVVITHKNPTHAEEEQYQVASKILAGILRKKGAQVIVTPTFLSREITVANVQ